MNVMNQRREQLGWSQAKLARQVEMHPSTVSQIETGKMLPYPSQASRLAEALGCDPEDLLKDVDHGPA